MGKVNFNEELRDFSPSPLYIMVFHEFPPERVTKFLVKISQFKFLVLVMTVKKIFVCKLFLSLNISDFSLFFM